MTTMMRPTLYHDSLALPRRRHPGPRPNPWMA